MRDVVAVYVIPVPDGDTKASAYKTITSQLIFNAIAKSANGELKLR